MSTILTIKHNGGIMMASNPPPPMIYDWADRYTSDPRTTALQLALDRILANNFPSIAARYQKPEPPRQRYAPPHPVVANGQNGLKAHQNNGTKVPPAPIGVDRAVGENRRRAGAAGTGGSPGPPSSQAKLGGREFVDAGEYLTEASSDMDSQAEIDPMEELGEMERLAAEGKWPPQPRRLTKKNSAPELGVAAANAMGETSNGGDVDMEEADMGEEVDNGLDHEDMDQEGDGNNNADVEDGDEEAKEEEEDEADTTACAVCNISKDDDRTLVCDCGAEYHIYCLDPPLPDVPEGDWFCPQCVAKAAGSTPSKEGPMTREQILAVKEERAAAANATATGTQDATAEASATSISIAQSFQMDAGKCNELLVHACQCATNKCNDPAYHEFCPHMKRFLRSACWASHNDKWLQFRIAKVTAELFAYHSLHCDVPQCTVPLCDELRAEEYV